MDIPPFHLLSPADVQELGGAPSPFASLPQSTTVCFECPETFMNLIIHPSAAPVGNCVKLSKIPCTTFHFVVSTAALLFFFRVCAVYGGNKYITAVFAVLWLSVLGCSLTVITSISGIAIGTTNYCWIVCTHVYASSASGNCLPISFAPRQGPDADDVSGGGMVFEGEYGDKGVALPENSAV